jgi:hypothetical protein
LLADVGWLDRVAVLGSAVVRSAVVRSAMVVTAGTIGASVVSGVGIGVVVNGER